MSDWVPASYDTTTPRQTSGGGDLFDEGKIFPELEATVRRWDSPEGPPISIGKVKASAITARRALKKLNRHATEVANRDKAERAREIQGLIRRLKETAKDGAD